MNDSDIAVSQSDSGKVAAFMSRVYSWMLFGIFLSAITAYFTQLHIPDLIEYIRENPSKVDLIKNVYMGLVFFEIIMVVCLVALVKRMSPLVATFVYLFYTF